MLSAFNKTHSRSFSLFLCIFSQSKSGAGAAETNVLSVQRSVEGEKILTVNLQSYFKDFLFLPTRNFYFQKSSVFTHALNNPSCHQIFVEFCLLFFNEK